MVRLLLSVLLLFMSLSARADTALLVVGDSLSAGYGIPMERAWPSLLQQRLTDQRQPYRVVNLSISGDTSAGGRARLPEALARHRPGLVVLALGANDGLRGLPPVALRENLLAMIRAAQAAGARVLVIGMRLPPNYGPDYTAQFEAAFRDAARIGKAPLLPFLLAPIASDAGAFQADGLHPTAPAQPLILDHVWPALIPLLRSPGQRSGK